MIRNEILSRMSRTHYADVPEPQVNWIRENVLMKYKYNADCLIPFLYYKYLSTSSKAKSRVCPQVPYSILNRFRNTLVVTR